MPTVASPAAAIAAAAAAPAARHGVAEGHLNAGVKWDQPVRNTASDWLTGGNCCVFLFGSVCVCV